MVVVNVEIAIWGFSTDGAAPALGIIQLLKLLDRHVVPCLQGSAAGTLW